MLEKIILTTKTLMIVANLSNMSFNVRKSLQEAVSNISKHFLLKKLPFTDIWVLAMDEIFELWIEITVTFDVCWTVEMTNFRQNTSSCGQIQPDYIHFHSFNIWDPTQALDHKWYEEKIFKMLLSSRNWQNSKFTFYEASSFQALPCPEWLISAKSPSATFWNGCSM